MLPIAIAVYYFFMERSSVAFSARDLVIYSLTYLYCSTFYQPDLDQEVNRPKKEYFPHGESITKLPYFKKWVSKLFRPINRAWYYYWQLYGNLLTHRGMSHWPILSVVLRNSYLFLPVIFLDRVVDHYLIDLAMDYYKESLPWNTNFKGHLFIVYVLPVYMSDINHILIDFIESKMKGNDFCPPKLKRGYLAKLFFFFK